MTLEFARSLPTAPGTNVRGEQADTSWLFLLPTLELGDAVVIGSAPKGTLKALAPLSSRLTVSRPTPLMRRRIKALGPGAVEIEPPFPGPTPATGAAGLIYVGAGSLPRVCGDPAALRRLAATIDAGGTVYLAPGGRRARRAAAGLARRLGIETCVVVGTARGTAAGAGVAADPVAWAVPAQAVAVVPVPRIVRRILGFAVRRARRSLRRRSTDSARVSEPGRSLGVERIAGIEELGAAGRGVLLRSAADGRPGATPAYLLEAARAARFPLSEHAWRLAPPRGYRSQKVIFFVRGGDESAVVKLTQDPAFNVLLDNEADALEAFGESVEGGPAIPQLHFRARHAGLTLVAESALDGRPFVQGASPAEWDEDASAVTTAITVLGRQTSHPAGPDVGDALGEIAGRFAALYRPPAAERDSLATAASELAELGPTLPLVFMHGDATVFNVLVGADRRVGLVDWENAERSGMPLWDLFHFLQAHAAWQAESSGARYTPRTFVDQVVGPAATRHIEVTDAYCAALEVPAGAVGSLRRLWLARHAVREARQLPPSRLGDGLYHRMLSAWLNHSG